MANIFSAIKGLFRILEILLHVRGTTKGIVRQSHRNRCAVQRRYTPEIPSYDSTEIMGLPQDISSADEPGLSTDVPYPAQTKQAAAQIDGILTEVMAIFFSDRIMISISQEGRLAQWVLCHQDYEVSSKG